MKTEIQNYFKSYPDSQEVFSTSSGLLFHKKHDAEAHADTLSDKRVGEHKRGDYPADAPEKTSKVSKVTEGGAAPEKPAKTEKTADAKSAKEVKGKDAKGKADKKADVKVFKPAGSEELDGDGK